MDPEPRLRRPVTPFGVGTILDGTGTGGGLEIVESGWLLILWEVAEEGANDWERMAAFRMSSREGGNMEEQWRGTGH